MTLFVKKINKGLRNPKRVIVHGFRIAKKVDFEYPWNGQHVSLTLKEQE